MASDDVASNSCRGHSNRAVFSHAAGEAPPPPHTLAVIVNEQGEAGPGRTCAILHRVAFNIRSPGRKPGACLYTRVRLYLSLAFYLRIKGLSV